MSCWQKAAPTLCCTGSTKAEGREVKQALRTRVPKDGSFCQGPSLQFQQGDVPYF